jgi:propanol-preferring alcohol dehydrogenase
MKVMILEKQNSPLILKDVPVPEISGNQILIKVHACGVCRTDLHIVDGELTSPKLPLIIGHEITGEVVKPGKTTTFKIDDRVGVPWLGYTCGYCRYCKSGKENLCENAKFTGYTIDGGYAEYTAADEKYCFKLPEDYNYINGAPLLCAGLIGYRSYRMTGEPENIGIYGFGGAAHIITQIAAGKGKKIYAFTKPGDKAGQEFAKSLGAVWAGDADEAPPVKLDASIIFAPAGELIPAALRVSDKGGIVVCGGIHMSDIPSFSYSLLWEERIIKSVANLTREDGEALMKAVQEIPVKTEVQVYKLEEANKALSDLRDGKVRGAAVLKVD